MKSAEAHSRSSDLGWLNSPRFVESELSAFRPSTPSDRWPLWGTITLATVLSLALWSIIIGAWVIYERLSG
jgi:hypothetical protein